MAGCSLAEEIARLKACAKGFEAQISGVPFDVYRLKSTVSGDFIQDDTRIAQNFLCSFKVTASKGAGGSMEVPKWQELVVYELTGNFTQFHVGDVFVCRDTANGDNKIRIPGTAELNAFTLTCAATGKLILGARINTQIRLRRQSKDTDSDGFFSATSSNSQALKIMGGRCKLQPAEARGHLIPAGLVAARGTYGERVFDDVPSMERKSSWICFVPPLPDFKFREGDRVEGQDGARYKVVVAYGEEVGFVGSQLFLERENAQPG